MLIVASVALNCALFHPPLRHHVAVFSVVLSHGQNARAHASPRQYLKFAFRITNHLSLSASNKDQEKFNALLLITATQTTLH
jgi:hypothetical protein